MGKCTNSKNKSISREKGLCAFPNAFVEKIAHTERQSGFPEKPRAFFRKTKDKSEILTIGVNSRPHNRTGACRPRDLIDQSGLAWRRQARAPVPG